MVLNTRAIGVPKLTIFLFSKTSNPSTAIAMYYYVSTALQLYYIIYYK